MKGNVIFCDKAMMEMFCLWLKYLIGGFKTFGISISQEDERGSSTAVNQILREVKAAKLLCVKSTR